MKIQEFHHFFSNANLVVKSDCSLQVETPNTTSFDGLTMAALPCLCGVPAAD
jgi:hypothetical protein